MNNALTIQDLRKTYANGAEALRGIDLQVEEGDFFALLGPNGAGKSTTIGIICSLVNKTSGSVQVFGHDIDTQRDDAKSCIGLVPQEFNFNQFEPVIEIVINQAGYYGIPRKEARERAEYYVQKLGLWHKRRNIGRELSGGMKRRLMIARALVHEPKLLILDEPTAGVDIEIRRSMWQFMQETNAQGTTIILTTHYLEEAENLCKNIAIINNGLMVEHTAMNILLRKLHEETFLLNLQDPIDALPSIEGYKMSLVDKDTLSVEINREQDLNNLFRQLDRFNIQVTSLRNKTNRLEEVFVRMMGNNSQ
ncbi:MAG: ABC transporter ATP-binding protein [Thiohalomonadales bacterium]|nr:ABC transporter ATP-binding protein [Thiohalomonadales bacterium]